MSAKRNSAGETRSNSARRHRLQATTLEGLAAYLDVSFPLRRIRAGTNAVRSPLWVILTFSLIGLVFIPIGIVLKSQADGVFEQVVVYDSKSPDVDCSISQPNQGYDSIVSNSPMQCLLTFELNRDIPEGTKINVYYQLTNFFQNHRRYVKSRSDDQVGGKFVPADKLGVSCDPNGSFVSSDTGLYFAPCGLIATSFFNDAFFLQAYNGQNASSKGVRLDETNIAWRSDVEAKFFNPTNPAGSPPGKQPLNNWGTYQYLWQTYDQMSCYSVTNGSRVACLKWGDLISGAFGKGCAKCNPGSVARYEGGIAPPGGPEVFDPTPGVQGNKTAPYGFRDEHFIVWMRTAGLPTFRKLYGSLVPPKGGFQAGDKLQFSVVPNFEVASFNSTKALILSTTTPTGGKSSVLGVAYLAVGSLCVALAISFAIKHIVSPRKLGDPQYIVAKHG